MNIINSFQNILTILPYYSGKFLQDVLNILLSCDDKISFDLAKKVSMSLLSGK